MKIRRKKNFRKTSPEQVKEKPEATVPPVEEHKRIVFRHPDTKSVLDQLFPLVSSPSKPEPKNQNQQQNNQRQNNKQNNQNTTIIRKIAITIITITTMLRRKQSSAAWYLDGDGCVGDDAGRVWFLAVV